MKMSIFHAIILSISTLVSATTFAQDSSSERKIVNTPAYMVAEFDLKDTAAIQPYRDQVEATFKPYSGRFLVRGGTPITEEGQAPNGRVVITKFDSMAQAQAWYKSAEYQEIAPIRKNAGITNLYFIEGVPGE